MTKKKREEKDFVRVCEILRGSRVEKGEERVCIVVGCVCACASKCERRDKVLEALCV